MPELQSPVKLLDGRQSPFRINLLESSWQNSNDFLHNPSLINHANKTDLEKAMKKINKLKMKIKQQEQIIEEHKLEIKQLRDLLIEKSPEKGLNVTPELIKIKNNEKIEDNCLEKYQRKAFSNKIINKYKPRIDENDFWMINDTYDVKDSIKFEEIAASKDLWLMSLFKQQKIRPQNIKIIKNLPPIKSEKLRQPRSINRGQSVIRPDNRTLSNNPPILSSKTLKKHR